MPLYDFANEETGEQIEESFSMTSVPSVGQTIVRNGKTYRRVFSSPEHFPQLHAGIAQLAHGYPYVSQSLPRNINVPGVKCDPRGRPIIASRSQEIEVCARGGLVRD